MKRIDMVREGTDLLFVAENAIEQAICDVSGLMNGLVKMRLTSNLSVMHGQAAIDGLAEITTYLTTSRSRIIEVHKALSEVKTNIGCDAVMIGNIVDKPPQNGDPSVMKLKQVA